MSGQQHAPARTLPPGKTRYPLYRRLGGPQGRPGRTENLFPTGIRSRTVQPVVVAIPTELPGPQTYIHTYIHTHTHTHIYIYRYIYNSFLQDPDGAKRAQSFCNEKRAGITQDCNWASLVHDSEEEFSITAPPTGILITDKQVFFCCISALVFIQAFFAFCQFIAFLTQVVLKLCGARLQSFTLPCIMNCDILLQLSSRMHKNVQ